MCELETAEGKVQSGLCTQWSGTHELYGNIDRIVIFFLSGVEKSDK